MKAPVGSTLVDVAKVTKLVRMVRLVVNIVGIYLYIPLLPIGSMGLVYVYVHSGDFVVNANAGK